MNATIPNPPASKPVAELLEGDRFSLDGGRTWHCCSVNIGDGVVAVYLDDTRDDESPTERIFAAADDSCLVMPR